MVRESISSNGQTSLAFNRDDQIFENYQETFVNRLFHVGEILSRENLIFQHDSISKCTANSTPQWLPVFNWPPLISHLSSTENVLGILIRTFYQNGRQYSSVKNLKSAIENAWFEIKLEIIQNLCLSMEHHIFQITKCNRAIINH